MAQSTPENLERLAELIDNGTVCVPIQQSFQLDQATEAMQTQQTEHTQGKLGLAIV